MIGGLSKGKLIRSMKRYAVITFFTLFITTSLLACGIFRPKVEDTKGKLSNEDELVLDQIIQKRINKPQNKPKDESKWGKDSATAVEKYTLYREYYKQDNLKDAYPFWRWLFFNAPAVSENLYIHGGNMLDYKIKNSEGAVKDAYVDTLMMLYDQRIQYFDNEAENLGRKGSDLIKYKPGEYAKAFEILDKSVDMAGKKTQSYVPYYYIFAAVQLHKNNKLEKEKLLDIYEKISGIIAENLKEDESRWSKIQNLVDDLVANYLTCEDLLPVYKAKFDKVKDDLDALKNIQKGLNSRNCTTDPFYLKVNEQVFAKEPSADAAFGIGRGYEIKGNKDKALEYYQKAIDLEKDNMTSADYALAAANVYKDMGSYSKARDMARKAIGLNPNLGKAYLFIGDLYVAGRKSCGDKFEQQTVYWAAVDKYIKARNVDPSVADEANKRINTYSAAFPSKNDIFFRNLEPNQSYTVGCWINETTTVRAGSE